MAALVAASGRAAAQTPPADAPKTPPASGSAGQGSKAPATKSPAKEKTKEKAKEKKDADAAKQSGDSQKSASDGTASGDSAPGNVPPEMEKIAKLAANAKFKEYVAMAADRQKIFVRRSALRMAMRGTEPTQAQRDELESLNNAIAKANDRMDGFLNGKTWTPDDYAAMDWIVQEAMRLYPIE
jgi:hypothetical protein